MIFTIIIVIAWIVLFLILEIIVGGGGEFIFIGLGLIGGFVICIIMASAMKVSLDKVEWKIIESYEITYKPDFDNSPIFSTFEGGKLKIYIKNNDDIKEVLDFVITDGEVASYKLYKKYGKGNFFFWENEEIKEEISIPIDVMKKWKGQK